MRILIKFYKHIYDIFISYTDSFIYIISNIVSSISINDISIVHFILGYFHNIGLISIQLTVLLLDFVKFDF